MTLKQYQKWYFKNHNQYEKLALSILNGYLRKKFKEMPNLTESNFKQVLNNYLTVSGLSEAYKRLYIEVGTAQGMRVSKGIDNGLGEVKAENPFNTSGLFSQNWFRFIQDYFGNFYNRIVTVNQDLIEGLIKIIEDSIAEGEGIDPITRRLQEKIGSENDLYGWQMRRIARTETGAAANLAAMHAMENSNLVIDKTWVSAIDERTREGHEFMNGKTVGLKEYFAVPLNVGEDSETIENLLYPCDINGSAGNVINCRCAIAPKIRRQPNGLPIRKT